MPDRVRVLTVPDADRAELERRAGSKGRPGEGGGAGPDRAAGRGRADRRAGRGTGGLYRAGGGPVAPPVRRVRAVACVDEEPQIQALDRTRPVLPVRPGVPGRHTRDSARHGTTALPAAPQAAAGTVTGARDPRRRPGEFPRFPTKAAA